MRRYNPFYFISQAIMGLARNGVMTFASIAVLTSLLVVIGGFALLVTTLNVNLKQFGLMNEIVVFVNTDATEEEIVEVGDKIALLDNIADIRRVTKAEGLAEMKEEYDVYDDVSEENNPLPDSFVITFSDSEKVPELDYQLKQIDNIMKVNNRLDLATKIESFKHGVMLIFIWFLIILTVVSLFIIINTIKLSVIARQKEISVMRYIGATGMFISLPFVFEGVFIGTISSVIAYFIEWYIYSYVEKMVSQDLQMITIIQFGDIKTTVLLGFVAIGIVAGIIGSSISLGKYLQK